MGLALTQVLPKGALAKYPSIFQNSVCNFNQFQKAPSQLPLYEIVLISYNYQVCRLDDDDDKSPEPTLFFEVPVFFYFLVV